MKFAIIGCNSEDAISFPHEVENVTTPYGSARVIHATLPDGKQVDFLTRHSICLKEDAYETNFRANIYALYMCGVTHIISISVMGTCDYAYNLGSFCLISDFIDYTRLRESSFSMEHRLVRHAGMEDVFDPHMNDVLEKIIEDQHIPYEGRSIYACTDGPRYETAAEVRMMRALDVQVMGSTLVPEAPLCREVCIKYASIGIIARYATGMYRDVTDEDLLNISAQHKGVALDVALKAIEAYTE
ncbi:MAG: MTAP family purine nucleoside phosphorylase [Clostridia bacterium]|nr:MTAP family purine nucleoside phosphorylase [Clostridia bacterium]